MQIAAIIHFTAEMQSRERASSRAQGGTLSESGRVYSRPRFSEHRRLSHYYIRISGFSLLRAFASAGRSVDTLWYFRRRLPEWHRGSFDILRQAWTHECVASLRQTGRV